MARARTTQYTEQPAMKAPRPLRTLGARGPFGLAINAAQVADILRGDPELANHAGEFVFQFRGVKKLFPLKRPPQQVEAIFVGGLGDLKLSSRSFVNHAQRSLRVGSKSQGHGDGLTLGSRKVLEVLFGEALK